MRALRQAHRESQDQGAPLRHPLHQGQAGRGAGRLTRAGRLALTLYGTAAIAYVLDRVSKILAEHLLQDHPPAELIPGVLQLRFSTNPGGAFGLFGEASWLFVLISVVVVGVAVVASRNLPGSLTAVGLGLLLGGALGNLTDRLVRGSGFDGQVVDFIDFHVWPVFNLADTAIVIGALILVFSGFRRGGSPGDAVER
jgi:signal peptidase II